MPAKVVEPNGNQNVNGIENCGYLEKADKPLDEQGALERIPFINDFNLEYGDLVVYETVKDCIVTIKNKDDNGKKGKIKMAVVEYNPNVAETWENEDFKAKWAKWSTVINNEIIFKLKLKDGVTPEIIRNIRDAAEYKTKKQDKG